MGLWTLGRTACGSARGRQYAKRYRTAQGRAGAGQQGEDGDSGSEAGGHVGDGHEKLALAASLTTSLSCSHLRPEAPQARAFSPSARNTLGRHGSSNID